MPSAEWTSLILPSGDEVFFDSADAPLVKQYRWRILSTRGLKYAQATGPKPHRKTLLMHRVIMGESPLSVDHVDGDGLNNRRANLRHATHSEQQMNVRARRKSALIHSRFKGVAWATDRQAWVARIVLNGRIVKRITCATEEDAALWYNAMALKYHGEFARLNEVS